MKKIYPQNNKVFEIAKIIKTKFPKSKIFIQKLGKSLIIKLPKNLDHLQSEELKLLLKTKYPQLKLNFQYFI